MIFSKFKINKVKVRNAVEWLLVGAGILVLIAWIVLVSARLLGLNQIDTAVLLLLPTIFLVAFVVFVFAVGFTFLWKLATRD